MSYGQNLEGIRHIEPTPLGERVRGMVGLYPALRTTARREVQIPLDESEGIPKGDTNDSWSYAPTVDEKGKLSAGTHVRYAADLKSPGTTEASGVDRMCGIMYI